MTISLRNRILLSIGFGIFQLLINLFFGSFDFLFTEINDLIYFITVFIIVVFSEFILLVFANKKENKVNKILFSSSFLISGILSGSILFFLLSQKNEHFFIYVAAFLVASFLPTVLFLLYFIFKEAEDKISKMGKASIVSGENEDHVIEKSFHLENERGKLLLEVTIKNIVCFEANDNYVITYFLGKNGELKKSMERISLKKIEEMLSKEDVVFNRVHKSYLINPEFLSEIKGKTQAYKIQLLHFEELIPVSRSYDINQLAKI